MFSFHFFCISLGLGVPNQRYQNFCIHVISVFIDNNILAVGGVNSQIQESNIYRITTDPFEADT